MEIEQFKNIEKNISLKKYNTYQIESYTKYLFHPVSIEELQKFLIFANQNHIDYFVIGNGSNLILSDGTYPGVIIKLDHLKEIHYDGNLVTVGAGVLLNKLSYDILDHGLKGLEWASGIPGTMGGSIFGNAGAYNEEIFSFIESVSFLTKDAELHTMKKESLSYGYRTSFFKEQKEKGIIVSATLKLSKGNKEESLKLIEDRFKRRQESQPLDKPSAGSVFRNPSKENPSWAYISEVGLKGYRIGDAMVSEKHANFIVNMGHATGKEIQNLIELIQEKVKKEKNVDLILEQEYKRW